MIFTVALAQIYTLSKEVFLRLQACVQAALGGRNNINMELVLPGLSFTHTLRIVYLLEWVRCRAKGVARVQWVSVVPRVGNRCSGTGEAFPRHARRNVLVTEHINTPKLTDGISLRAPP